VTWPFGAVGVYTDNIHAKALLGAYTAESIAQAKADPDAKAKR
jgi:hypothetical protein